MLLLVLAFALATVIYSQETVDRNSLSGFGPYLIDYSRPSENLAMILPAAELRLRTGGDETLTDDELEVDKYMRKLRNKILSENDSASGPLFKVLSYANIEALRNTPLYNLFKDMPKGGNIHLHLKLSGSYSQLINELINYQDTLYVVQTNNSTVGGANSNTITLNFDKNASDLTLKKYIQQTQNCDDVNFGNCRSETIEFLLKKCTFGSYYEDVLNKNGSPFAWSLFNELFATVSKAMNFADVMKWQMTNLVNASRQENVDYLELRTSLRKLFRFDSTTNASQILETNEELSVYQQGLNDANYNIPSDQSVTATLIPTGDRSSDIVTANVSINITQQAWSASKNNSNSLIPTLGYDLVGQEDLGYSWLYHDQVENMFQIVKDSGQKSPIHAGETNWGAGLNRMTNLNHVPQDANTFSPEKNLLTAIKYSDDQLVPRVGHGLALAHHPLWIESMRAKGQCVVVMALSNHMLQYVQDLRRHPLAGMINAGLKVVLSGDDPALYQVSFTDEFLAAYITGNLDIAALKTIIKNSYECSLLSDDDKKKKIEQWEEKWKAFIAKYVLIARQGVACNGNDPCGLLTWSALDDQMFNDYSAFHKNTQSFISASTDINCPDGQKFVIPQSRCYPFCMGSSSAFNSKVSTCQSCGNSGGGNSSSGAPGSGKSGGDSSKLNTSHSSLYMLCVCFISVLALLQL